MTAADSTLVGATCPLESPEVYNPPMGKEGATLAGRYRLRKLIDTGASGQVWEAEDPILEDIVAVKLFEKKGLQPARVRREIAALRLLRLPGVVRLLDEGIHDERPFLVMERVYGSPFPARDQPCSWDDIAPSVMSLLETLARVHAHNVIHRDLKPSNVLVSENGQPTVLDFGISTGSALGDGLTRDGVVLGTPAYLAPEQILGDQVGPWTDLYAVGVMIFEALSGELPHSFETLSDLIAHRLEEPVKPLNEIVPALPPVVAATVGEMLAVRPIDRPRSATAVIARLSSEATVSLDARSLPRLGSNAPVEMLSEALADGRSIDLVGPAGSGRTRCLNDVRALLEASGRRVVSLRSGPYALSSLEPVLGSLEMYGDQPLDDVIEQAREGLHHVLEQGAILLADNAESLDALSAQLLDALRDAGALARVFLSGPGSGATEGSTPEDRDNIIRLGLLDENDLRSLFAGKDRILHIREDGARVLWERTHGLARRVAEEVLDWELRGLAHWEGRNLVIDRGTLTRLAMDSWSTARARRASIVGSEHRQAPRDYAELCEWIGFATPHATIDLLTRAMSRPRFQLEFELAHLAESGIVSRLGGGRYELAFDMASAWHTERVRQAHRSMAELLPVGTDGRLFHLIASEDMSQPDARARVAEEALALSHRHAADGYLVQATELLNEGLIAIRRHSGLDSPCPAEVALLEQWIEIAMTELTSLALDRIAYELSRCAHKTVTLTRLTKLVHVALAILHAGSGNDPSQVDTIPKFADRRWELLRQEVRVLGARLHSRELSQRIVEDAAAWAESTGAPHTLARRASWLGRLRYRQGDYLAAARLHEEAASGEQSSLRSIAAQLLSASALMEGFRLREAAEQAEKARALAARYREASYEARAEWILRTAAYRLEEALEPDGELVDIVTHLGVVELEALVSLAEAAIAWRAESYEQARVFGGQSHRIWRRLGLTWSALLMRALVIASHGDTDDEEIRALYDRACTCPTPGIGIQIVGLLAMRWEGAEPLPLAAGSKLAELVPKKHWTIRMDVLSVAESLASLRAMEARWQAAQKGRE